MENCACQLGVGLPRSRSWPTTLTILRWGYSIAGEGVRHAALIQYGALAFLVDHNLTAKNDLTCAALLRNVRAKPIQEVFYV